MNSDILFFFLLINLLTLVVFGVDKYLATTQRYRISEKSLLILAMAGGCIGAIGAQRLFRHKTQKFRYVLWMILIVHISLGWWVWTSGSK